MSTVTITRALSRQIDFTDEELSAQEDISAYIVRSLKAAAETMDGEVTNEMEERGLDLRITLEVRPR